MAKKVSQNNRKVRSLESEANKYKVQKKKHLHRWIASAVVLGVLIVLEWILGMLHVISVTNPIVIGVSFVIMIAVVIYASMEWQRYSKYNQAEKALLREADRRR